MVKVYKNIQSEIEKLQNLRFCQHLSFKTRKGFKW